MHILQFRKTVYQSFVKRADAGIDLIDALTASGHIESVVGLSEVGLFRRRHSMVYDVLKVGELDIKRVKQLFCEAQAERAERIAGYAVYAVDATENERPEAQTLADRGILKADQFDALRFGHKYSWLVRLVEWGTSWTAPVDVGRVATQESESRVGGQQVEEMAGRDTSLKVVTADSLYGNDKFLPAFARLPNTEALVRMRSTNVLWEKPQPYLEHGRGRPALHGAKFSVTQPTRPAERVETFRLGERQVLVQAWSGLHFKKMPQIEGTAVRIEFFRLDNSPCYARPIWLFWTGPANVSLQDLCRMYLWRFAIEHTFRFLKQHVGLNVNRSTHLNHTQEWMWLCAIGYWHLLLLRTEAANLRPAWYPQRDGTKDRPLTPRLVQRQAQVLLLRLGTPAAPLRPAGKGRGRPFGFHPKPKPHFRVAKKSKPPLSPPLVSA